MGNINLVAYIPVLNKRHLDWFSRYPDATLGLISQELATRLDHRQGRNIVAMPTELTADFIENSRLLGNGVVNILKGPCVVTNGLEVILADEDVCHLFAERELLPKGAICRFEQIWARYDMSAIQRQSPVMADVEVTSDQIQVFRLEMAKKISLKSPDWWRQVGAALFVNDDCVAISYNRHYPTEYEADMFSDPRLTLDAGQIGKYLSLHAERGVIALCARNGVSTLGASIYVTVFPCEDCAREIVAAGIKKIFFEEGYSSLNGQEVLRMHGVKIVKVNNPESA